VVLVLLLPGMLLAYISRQYLGQVLALDLIAGLVTLGFVFSLASNMVIAILWSAFRFAPEYLAMLFLSVNGVLMVLCWQGRNKRPSGKYNKNYVLLGITSVAFLLMWNNGGLIDRLADSWWHMSLANKIAHEQSLFLNKHHLTGDGLSAWKLVYEPGWHINLAMLMKVSGSSAPLIWHVLGSWCTIVALLSYYLFSMSLTKSRSISTIAIPLMFILLGGINAYFRVSPWPGNVSYSVMYLAFAVVFVMADAMSGNASSRSGWIGHLVPESVVAMFRHQKEMLFLLLVLIFVITTIHLAEIILFIFGLVFYSYGIFVVSGLQRESGRVGYARGWDYLDDGVQLGWLWPWFFITWSIIAAFKSNVPNTVILVAMGILAIIAMASQLPRLVKGKCPRLFTAFSVFIMASAMLVVVDVDQFIRLFSPDLEGAHLPYPYIPAYTEGYFSEVLRYPHWEHQLRAGLLFSGFIAVLSSAYLVIRTKNRCTVFLGANAVMAFFVLISPYFFTYFTKLLPATGVYRLHILIFHPIILACLLVHLLSDLKVDKK
jgi:hypothetical protein